MFDMSPGEFVQQQAAVLRNQAIHAARYQEVDTTAVLDTLTFLIPKFPAESVVSNALTDALRSIEADIDNSMKDPA